MRRALTCSLLVALLLSETAPGVTPVFDPRVGPPSRRMTLQTGPVLSACVSEYFSQKPLPDAQVETERGRVPLDRRGCFTLSELDRSDLKELRISDPGHYPMTWRLNVRNDLDSPPHAEPPLILPLTALVEGTIKGRVHDSATGAPVPFASVKLHGSYSLAVTTDASGEFELIHVPPGTHGVEVDNPEYEAVTLNNIVVDERGASAVLDVALAHRPTDATLSGRIVDDATGVPIASASVEMPGVARATTDTTGHYTLVRVPAGAVTLTLLAAGYPPTVRRASIVLPKEIGAPRLFTADFALSRSGITPTGVTRHMRAASEGHVQLPDGTLTLGFPKGSLSDDAEVSLRVAARPRTHPGDRFNLDPHPGISGIVAVGPEVELVLRAARDGTPPPQIVGPLTILAQYEAQEVERWGFREDGMALYAWDGTVWQLLRIVPYIHAVDLLNRLLLTMILPEAEDVSQAGVDPRRETALSTLEGDARRYVLHLGAPSNSDRRAAAP